DEGVYGPPHLSAGKAKAGSGIGAQSDLQLRHENLRFDLQHIDPFHVGHDLLDLLGFAPQYGQVRTIDPANDQTARSGQHFFNCFLKIREQVALKARVSVHDVLDLCDRLFVGDFVVNADPQFSEIRPDDFIGDFGAADVRAEILHAFDRP